MTDPTPTRALDLSELRRLIEAATPGPWVLREETGMDEAWCDWHDVGPLSLMGGYATADTRLVMAAVGSVSV